MKYIIDRSSSYKGAPIKECSIELLHGYEYFRFDANRIAFEQFKMTHHDIKAEDDGYYRGTSNNATLVAYVAEINDLHEFVKQYGPIVMFEPNNEEGLFVIEIYDDYRE